MNSSVAIASSLLALALTSPVLAQGSQSPTPASKTIEFTLVKKNCTKQVCTVRNIDKNRRNELYYWIKKDGLYNLDLDHNRAFNSKLKNYQTPAYARKINGKFQIYLKKGIYPVFGTEGINKDFRAPYMACKSKSGRSGIHGYKPGSKDVREFRQRNFDATCSVHWDRMFIKEIIPN